MRYRSLCRIVWFMTITMNDTQLTSLSDIKQFLAGSLAFNFKAATTQKTYDWIQETLIRLHYLKLGKSDKTTIKLYLQKVTGYSRSQTTRLIGKYLTNGRVIKQRYSRHVFTTKYSRDDLVSLAKTDALHDTPNGRAIKRILEREAGNYGRSGFRNLSSISVSHIYNLRQTPLYRRINVHLEKTKSVRSAIGERRKPRPNGSPGYLRVDSVHQGDLESEKGVYHINIVDEVTQFEFVGAVEHISESYLLPMLEKLIKLFPFRIIEIHSDNGSEYINRMVAELLEKLRIGLTKSRSRKSNDNALVEGKNGAVVRKWIGYAFLPRGYAKQLNRFYFGCFHEYINYHRPCAFPTLIVDKRGKEKKVYKQENYQTPLEKLLSLPRVDQLLKPSVTIDQLTTIAAKYSDNEMAALVQEERSKLFDKTKQ